MAIIFESWQADGTGQSLISSIRSDIPDWFVNSQNWVESQKQNPLCVLITKNRTDNQSHWEHIIWQKPGYIDPCI